MTTVCPVCCLWRTQHLEPGKVRHKHKVESFGVASCVLDFNCRVRQ
ncbi:MULTISPECIES: hypothetical protein [unclassified Microcoleus]